MTLMEVEAWYLPDTGSMIWFDHWEQMLPTGGNAPLEAIQHKLGTGIKSPGIWMMRCHDLDTGQRWMDLFRVIEGDDAFMYVVKFSDALPIEVCHDVTHWPPKQRRS